MCHCKAIFWSHQFHSFCVPKILVEKLPSIVKLVSPFRYPINQYFFLVRFVVSFFDLEFLGCMVVVVMPGMQPNRSSEQIDKPTKCS